MHDKLEVLAEQFQQTPPLKPDDPEALTGMTLRQAICSTFLVELAHSLQELPTFTDSKSTALVHLLAGAMHDVVMGGRPDLLQPCSPGTAGGDGIRRFYVKVHAVLAVRVMVEAHNWPEIKARKLVTEMLAKAGAKGRKGARLTASTLQDWCASASPHDNARLDREVEYFMAEYRASTDWPGIESDAIRWIEERARHPLLALKYG